MRGDSLVYVSRLIDQSLITFAHQLADAAGEVIRPYFGAHGEVEAKGDTSPVTRADREAEAAMRALIDRHYPDHAIYGEEFGQQMTAIAQVQPSPNPLPQGEGSRASPPIHTTHHSPFTIHYTWVIDPIDGTRAFIEGRKEWGTLIALCADGVPVLGILDQPVTGERWVGVRGAVTQFFTRHSNGSWNPSSTCKVDSSLRWNDVANIKTRPCASLSEAEFSTTSAMYFTPVQAKQVVALAQACRAAVRDGDCYAYGLLARGMRDVVIDAGLKPYDILALVPIIEGAGGVITGWDGAPVTLTHYANVVAAGNADLHAQTVGVLGE